MSSPEHENLFARKTAFVFGSLLLAGFAVVSGLAALDQKERTQLEALAEPTGTGDPVVYQQPVLAPDAAPSPALVLQGVPLYAREGKKVSDSSMRKAGKDDAGKIPLYRRVRKDVLQKEVYLKVAPNRYAELAPEKKN